MLIDLTQFCAKMVWENQGDVLICTLHKTSKRPVFIGLFNIAGALANRIVKDAATQSILREVPEEAL